MFKAVQETDRYNNPQVHYYLTQGDSCTIRSTPYKDGQILSPDSIEKCVFKLSDDSYVEEFSKELPEEDGKYVLRLTSEESAYLEIATHIYEFEYTLVGGEVHTPNQWEFDIVDQIVT